MNSRSSIHLHEQTYQTKRFITGSFLLTAIPKSEDIRAVREVYLNFAVEDSNFQLFVETN